MTRLMPLVLALSVTACNGDTDETDPDTDPGTEVMSNTIVDIAAGDDRFEVLVGALEDADLVGLLSGDGDFTVFAPTDEAFGALDIDLNDLSVEELTEILQYHVIAGASVESGEVPALADSAAGFTLFFDTSDGVVVNDATVEQADIVADNGVIHAIDTVLLPPDILTAAGYAGLSSLATTIGDADASVADTLSGDGPFTVFAPTNTAFTEADLTGQDVDDVLFYHVAVGEVPSDSIPARRRLRPRERVRHRCLLALRHLGRRSDGQPGRGHHRGRSAPPTASCTSSTTCSCRRRWSTSRCTAASPASPAPSVQRPATSAPHSPATVRSRCSRPTTRRSPTLSP